MLSSETSDFLLLRFTWEIFFVTGFFSAPVFLLSFCCILVLGEGDPLLRFLLWTVVSHSFRLRFRPCVTVCVSGTISGNSDSAVSGTFVRVEASVNVASVSKSLSQKPRCPSCLCAHVGNVFSFHPLNRNKFHSQCISPLVLLY